jgi:hypothetical protein
MGTPKQPEPVKIFIRIMYEDKELLERALVRLDGLYGPRDISFGPLPFLFTDYYEKEMGKGLLKSYFCYKKLIARESLPAIKLQTNALEQEYTENANRRINIDPGYLSRDKLVLASTKDFFHRIYLSEGIFGEVTLHFRREVFRYFSWTYADYKDPGLHEMLRQARESLIEDIRSCR